MNLSPDGIPLTASQRVERYGARTRPTLRTRIPPIRIREGVSPVNAERALEAYEDIDRAAARTRRDLRGWIVVDVLSLLAVIFAIVGLLTGLLTVASMTPWLAVGAVFLIVGVPFTQAEKQNLATAMDEARAHADELVSQGVASLEG